MAQSQSTRLPATRRGGDRRQPGWIFALPAMIAFVVVVLYPAVSGAMAAFTSWDGLSGTRKFVGLDNFKEIASSGQDTGTPLKNTLILAMFVTVVQNALGLFFALVLKRPLFGRNVFRAIVFTPVVLASLAVAYVWQYIYAYDGPLNVLLGDVGFPNLQHDWLGDPDTALWTIGCVVIWQFMGVSMIIFLAGLEGIPHEIYQAASVDGSGIWHTFRYITLPLLRPAFVLNLIFSIVGCIQLFDQVFVMTGGGPGKSTATLSTELYNQSFILGHYGYGAALALLIAALALILGAAQLKLLLRKELT